MIEFQEVIVELPNGQVQSCPKHSRFEYMNVFIFTRSFTTRTESSNTTVNLTNIYTDAKVYDATYYPAVYE